MAGATFGGLAMGKMFQGHWWAVMARALLALVIGLMFWFWPTEQTIQVLAYLFAFFAILEGAILFVFAVAGRSENPEWWWTLLQSLFSFAAGLIVLFLTEAAILIVWYLIAAWAVFGGIFQVIQAIRLRDELPMGGLLIVAGLISVIFGLLMIGKPQEALHVIFFLIGLFAMVQAIVLLILALDLRRTNKQIAESVAGS